MLNVSLVLRLRSYDVATEEPAEEPQRLIDAGEDDALYGDAQKLRRTRSNTELKATLEAQGKTRSRDYLVKVRGEGEREGRREGGREGW